MYTEQDGYGGVPCRLGGVCRPAFGCTPHEEYIERMRSEKSTQATPFKRVSAHTRLVDVCVEVIGRVCVEVIGQFPAQPAQTDFKKNREKPNPIRTRNSQKLTDTKIRILQTIIKKVSLQLITCPCT